MDAIASLKWISSAFVTEHRIHRLALVTSLVMALTRTLLLDAFPQRSGCDCRIESTSKLVGNGANLIGFENDCCRAVRRRCV